MKKYWCEVGMDRYQVTIKNCVECDKNAGMPGDSYIYCTARKPYRMQILEQIDVVVWYLKTLWDAPKFFLVLLAKKIANRIGISATPMADKDGWHLIWVHT